MVRDGFPVAEGFFAVLGLVRGVGCDDTFVHTISWSVVANGRSSACTSLTISRVVNTGSNCLRRLSLAHSER